ncbi:MAG: neutral/alkaline non-lysosomal ceramidase N-terminal domain-containing protein [Clostridia bacterium]|nr:neutral/alkaline non-lysosomal ceramidase N-terminal domain-containing protein [Clostridia bacterium]
MLKACMTRCDITPPKGLELVGFPHYERNNTGVHDPLYAACMYLSDNGNEVAMITLDILYISKKHVEKIRKRAEELCGISGQNVMVSCSHTHSGPCAAGRTDPDKLLEGSKQPMEYIGEIIEKIAQLINEAKKNAFDAFFMSGTAVCGAESGVGGNRRVRGGPHDPLVSVLAIKDKEDNVRGAIVNYTLHPTFIHEWSTVCTADYPCYLKLEMEEKHKMLLTGFSQGTSGNQSSRYFRTGESYDEAERVGRTLGKAALKAIEKGEWKDTLEIKTISDSLPIELRSFGTEEELRARVAHDKAVYEELYAKYGKSENREEYYLWQNANLRMLGSEKQLAYTILLNSGARIELYEDENPSEIQAFNLGGTCIIGLQGEIFVEYGLWIKAMAGFGTVIVNELTNGVHPGYTYTPESLMTGGYETGNSLLNEKFGMHLTEKAIETARKIR